MTFPSFISTSTFKIFLGIFLAILFFVINPLGVSDLANKTLFVSIVMISWWITEALPMPVVGLVPLVLFPLMKILTIEKTAEAYANPIIFLFLGGFMLGLAIEKWNLHRRIALSIVKMTGTSGDRIIIGFIIATGLLSMWLSNTATTIMMLPIAISIIHVMKVNYKGEGNLDNFSLVLMLVIAMASNMSVGTIIGTPPNIAYVSHIQDQFKHQIGFMEWMMVCTPLSIALMVAMYFVLVKWLYPNHIKSNADTKALIHNQYKELGKFSTAEKRVFVIFVFTSLLWITRDLINQISPNFKLDDTIIALMSTILLFAIPSGIKNSENETENLLEWEDSKKMAWGILLLFGGGIALGKGLEEAKLVQMLGNWLASYHVNGFLLVVIVTTLSIFISELTSNVAQVIIFAPVVSSLAIAVDMNPLMLGIPMTMAASCASMLPMGTPPNAIVFSSGHIKLKQMAYSGFIMNIVSIILISVICWYLIPIFMKSPV
jgi:solute carrier family 13 (sodium-dependent dicarboxylate transporter), member 2/3/5